MQRTAFLLLWSVFGPVSIAQEPAETNYDEAKVPLFELPDPLRDDSGKQLGKEEWQAYRRAEVRSRNVSRFAGHSFPMTKELQPECCVLNLDSR